MKLRKKLDRNKVLFVILILTIFSIIINGYFYGAVGNTQWTIPIIRNYADKELFEHDLLAGNEIYSYGPYNYSFELFVAPLTKIIDIQTIFFAIFFFSVFFFLLAVFYLARLLFKNDSVAFMAVLLVMARKPALATSTFFPNYAGRMIVLPLLMLAAILLIKNRYYAASFVSGLAMNLHPILAFLFYSLFGIYFVINCKKIGIRKILASFALFFLAALPIFIWRVVKPIPGNLFIAPKSLFQLLSLTNQTLHTYPLNWPLGRWVRYFIFILAFIISLRYVTTHEESHKKMRTIFYGTFLLFLIGIIFSHFVSVPVPFILNLEIMRSSIFPVFIGCIYLAKYLVQLYPKDNFSKFVSIGIGVSVFISNFKSLGLFLILLFAYNYRKKHIIFISSIIIFASVFTLSVLASFIKIPYFASLKIGFAPSIIILLCMFILISYRYVGLRLKYIPYVIISVLILITSFFAVMERALVNIEDIQIGEFFLLNYKDSGSPLAAKNIENFLKFPVYYVQKSVQFPRHVPQNNWEDAQLWALHNTPKNAVFITPPHLTGFRVYSERSTVVDCDDRGQSNPHYIHGYEWINRVKIVCNESSFQVPCEVYCNSGYKKNLEVDFFKLASMYNISYIVVEKPKNLNFNLVYENEDFRIYKIKF